MTGIIFHFGTTMFRWYDRNRYMNFRIKFDVVLTVLALLAVRADAQHQNAGTVNYQHLLIDYDARSV